jgi:type IV secretion system protein VirB6
MACPSIAPGGAFLTGVLTYVDCQAQAIGQGGYQALTAPGSTVAVLLTGLLTIFVALFGYRMIFGQAPGAREGVLAMVKIGVVLALATSWPAFRTLAYNVAMQGPADLAASIGGSAGLPGSNGGLIGRLQGIDNGLAELQILGTGKPDNADEIVGPSAQPLTPEQQQEQFRKLQSLQQRPKWDPARDATMLSQARTLYLTGAIGSFASVRVIAGLLLALGPLFALFLLFDTTRGLFEGWVRGIAGAALGALSTAIVLGVQLALMEPWLFAILELRRQNIPTPTVPVEMLAMTLVFALTLLAGLIATAKVAQGFRMPTIWRGAASRWAEVLRDRGAQPAMAGGEQPEAIDQRTRAHSVADAVAASQRREAALLPPPPAQLGYQGATRTSVRDNPTAVPMPVPLGQSYRRRTRGRVSAGASRRDRNA